MRPTFAKPCFAASVYETNGRSTTVHFNSLQTQPSAKPKLFQSYVPAICDKRCSRGHGNHPPDSPPILPKWFQRNQQPVQDLSSAVLSCCSRRCLSGANYLAQLWTIVLALWLEGARHLCNPAMSFSGGISGPAFFKYIVCHVRSVAAVFRATPHNICSETLIMSKTVWIGSCCAEWSTMEIEPNALNTKTLWLEGVRHFCKTAMSFSIGISAPTFFKIYLMSRTLGGCCVQSDTNQHL